MKSCVGGTLLMSMTKYCVLWATLRRPSSSEVTGAFVVAWAPQVPRKYRVSIRTSRPTPDVPSCMGRALLWLCCLVGLEVAHATSGPCTRQDGIPGRTWESLFRGIEVALRMRVILRPQAKQLCE